MDGSVRFLKTESESNFGFPHIPSYKLFTVCDMRVKPLVGHSDSNNFSCGMFMLAISPCFIIDVTLSDVMDIKFCTHLG